MTNADFFSSPLRVVNVGADLFADTLATQNVPVTRVTWQPAAGNSTAVLSVSLGDPRVDQANQEAVQRMLAARPRLVDVRPAREAIPGMHSHLVLHAGPPITWERMSGPLRGAVIGALGVVHPQPGYYTDRHGQLAMAFAQQVGSALENARLYEQAQGTAVLEERQRLARELHDSVSQVLYSIALNAASAAALGASDPERAAALQHDVHELAGVGLAEMRALIFELRPESLEREGLVPALHKQADAVTARHAIAVHLSVVAEPEMSLAAKEALYRIAQEALQNVAKHARAQSVELTLEQIGSEVILRIKDDGRGFDAHRSFPGHLGLHSMRERMAGLGGTLHIQSSPGKGTCIEARLPIVAAVEHPVGSQ